MIPTSEESPSPLLVGALAKADPTLGSGARVADQITKGTPPPAQVASPRATPYDTLFSSAESKYGLPPGLLKAMASVESNFNPKAVSPKGASGLMQFMPATAKRFGIDPSDPAQAIDGAARYVLDLGKRFGGDVAKVVAAYNAGEGNVEKYGGIPPFKETQEYVQKVRSAFHAFGGGAPSTTGAPAQPGGWKPPAVGYDSDTNKVYVNGLVFDADDAAGWQASLKEVGKAGGALPKGYAPMSREDYQSKVTEATTSNATVGGALKSLGRSVISGVGAAIQAGAEPIAAAINAGRSPDEYLRPANVGDAFLEWSGLFKQTLGNQAAIATTKALQEGSILNPDDIRKGFDQASVGGLVHLMAQGLGSLAPGLVAGVVSPALGYAVFAGMAAGSNGEQTYNELMGKSRVEWDKIPEFRQLIQSGQTEYGAKNLIATRARQLVSTATAPIGAIDALLPTVGRLGARESSKILASMAKAAMKDSAFEAVQETAEGVLQNHVANKATGFNDDIMRGSLGNAVGGALAGGPTGGVVGAKSAIRYGQAEQQAGNEILGEMAQYAANAPVPPSAAQPQGALFPGGGPAAAPVAEEVKADPQMQAYHTAWQAAQIALQQAKTPEEAQQARHDMAVAVAGAQQRAAALQQVPTGQGDLFPDAPVPAAPPVPNAPSQMPAAATPGQAPSTAPSSAQGAPVPTVDAEVARIKKAMIDTATFPGDHIDSVHPSIRREVAKRLSDDSDETGAKAAQQILDSNKEVVKRAKKGKADLSDEDIETLAKAVRQQNNGARGPLKALHAMIAAWDKALGLAAGASSARKIEEHTGSRQAISALLHGEFKAFADEIGVANMDKVVARIKGEDATEGEMVEAGAQKPKNVKETGEQKQANILFSMAWDSYKTNGLLTDAISPSEIRYYKEKQEALKGIDNASKLEEILDRKAEDALKGRVVKGKRQRSWVSKHTGETPPGRNYFRIVGLLDHLLLHNKNLMTRVMATALRSAFERIRPEFNIVVSKDPHPKRPTSVSGNWNPTTRTLTIYPMGHNEQVILHELIHALTADYILNKFGTEDPHVKRFSDTFEKFREAATPEAIQQYAKDNKLRKDQQDTLNHMVSTLVGLHAGTTHKGEHTQDAALAEFISYGMTEQLLQGFMKSIKVESITDKMGQMTKQVGKPGARRAGVTLTLWSRFVEQMSQLLFGRMWSAVDANLMSQFLSDSAQLMHAAASEQTVERAAAPEPEPAKPPVVVEEPKPKVKKEPKPKKEPKAKAAPKAEPAKVEVGPAQTEWDEEYRAGDENVPFFRDLRPEVQQQWKELIEDGVANTEEFNRLVRLNRDNNYKTRKLSDEINEDEELESSVPTAAERAKRPEYWAARDARMAKEKAEAEAKAAAAAAAATSARERTEATRLKHAAMQSAFAGTKPSFKGPLGYLDAVYEGIFKAAGVDKLTKGAWKALEAGSAWVADAVPMYRSFLHKVVSGYGLSDAYLAARHTLQQGQVRKIRVATGFFKEFNELPPDQQLAVTEAILNPENTEFRKNLTKAQNDAIDNAKAILKELVDDGVRAGTLPKDLGDMDVGALLKAVYAKDVLGKEGKTGLMRSGGIIGTTLKDVGVVATAPAKNVMTSVTGRYRQAIQYRSDGTTVNHFVPVESKQAMDTLKAAVGEANLDIDDTNVWRLAKDKSESGVQTFFRPFSAEELTTAVNDKRTISDPRYLLHATVHHLMQDIMHAEMFNFLASYGRDNSEDTGAVGGPGTLVFDSLQDAEEHQEKYADEGVRPQNWVQIPTTTNKARQPKYGALAGKWVSESIWNDLSSQVDNAPLFPGYSKWLTRWKLAKTAYSPVTHFNNVASNFALAFYRDIPASNILKAAQIYWDSMHGTPEEKAAAQKLIDEFDDSGGNVGSYGQSELRRGQMLAILEELNKNGATETKGMSKSAALMKVMEMIEHVKASRPAKWAGMVPAAGRRLYESEDNIFRLASYITHIQNGESIGQAGLRASQDFVDYNITAPWINKLRGSFFPFIAWPYRMIPAMIGIAVEKPWKFATMMTALYGLNALGFALAAGDEEEERRFMPEYQKGGLGVWFNPVKKMVRLPWSNTYWDASAMMPFGDLTDMDPGGFFGAPWLKQFMPSGPVILLAEALFGYDSFRAQKITKDTHSAAENVAAVAKHVAQGVLPNVPIPGTRQFDTLTDVMRDKHGITGAPMNSTLKVMSMFGPKIYANDIGEERAIQGIVIKKKWAEYSAEMRSIANQEHRFGNPDQEKIRARIEELNQRFLKDLAKIQSP